MNLALDTIILICITPLTLGTMTRILQRKIYAVLLEKHAPENLVKIVAEAKNSECEFVHVLFGNTSLAILILIGEQAF